MSFSEYILSLLSQITFLHPGECRSNMNICTVEYIFVPNLNFAAFER
jgi:hypothetical protein